MNSEILKLQAEIAKIRESKIDKLTDRINQIRKECIHPSIKGEYQSNTGNYDPGADSYWVSGNCTECGSHLYADYDESPALYREYGQKLVK